MKKFRAFVFLCAVAQLTWAQTNVSTDSELRTAIANDGANITVTADIDLSNSTLSVATGTTVTINLGGHTLDRKLTQRGEGGGQVITVREGATLNLSNGTLKGGWGGNGGGIANEGGTANLTDVTITGCTGDDRGGGISNSGTLTMTGGAITGNISNDKGSVSGGGGLFNASGATATLTGVTITGNEAKGTGGGGICNLGTLTVDGCTITGNTCKTEGGGIWTETGVTLNMKGAMTVTDNTKAGGATNNLFLRTGALITVTGSLAGSSIGIKMETLGTFTSGYGTYNDGVDPATLFFPDLAMTLNVSSTGSEAQIAYSTTISYIECSWDSENNVVATETKTLESGQYTVLTGGGNTSLGSGYYVVNGNVSRGEIDLTGGHTVHLILCDGARLTANFIHMKDAEPNGRDSLFIYSQSSGGNMGRMRIDNSESIENAGIGTDYTTKKTEPSMGTLIIHGGDIYVQGGTNTAAIGGGRGGKGGHVYIYGGKVEAHGGVGSGANGGGGAGIGGGYLAPGGSTWVYGGEVYAYGGQDAAGIGSGDGGNVMEHSDPDFIHGGWFTMYGGYVETHGGGNGAGIGAGEYSTGPKEVNIYGGTVKAYGGEDAAGIGGGYITIDYGNPSGVVNIYGGEVYAKGGDEGAGIGGGENSPGAKVTITGGIVVAQAGANETGYKAIGGGRDSDDNGSLTLGDDRCVYITSNLWRSKKENRVSDCWGTQYLQISECRHGGATASVVNGDKHDMSNCKWCYVTSEESHTFGEDSQCNVCKLIRLEDESDNSALFSKWADDDPHDFLLSGRKLVPNSQIVNGEIVKSSRAYTVCLPFDMDLSERGDDLMLYTLSYIKDGKEMVFTQTEKKIEAGKPYLIVIHQGELELLGHSKLIASADEGVRVYDWENREQPLGWWRGTLTKIESADAAEMMAYALQSVGDFRRIRPDTPQAWWGAFRSMYCPDELPATNRLTINKGTFGGFGGNTPDITFEGDADIQDGTGIKEVEIVNSKSSNSKSLGVWYTLDGRKLDGKPSCAGVYINNGEMFVIK